MTNREAMEIVLYMAETAYELEKVGKSPESIEKNKTYNKIEKAIWQMQDYKNDLMREEQPTGCDYGIGG